MSELSPERLHRALELLNSVPEPEGTLEDVIADHEADIEGRFHGNGRTLS